MLDETFPHRPSPPRRCLHQFGHRHGGVASCKTCSNIRVRDGESILSIYERTSTTLHLGTLISRRVDTRCEIM